MSYRQINALIFAPVVYVYVETRVNGGVVLVDFYVTDMDHSSAGLIGQLVCDIEQECLDASVAQPDLKVEGILLRCGLADGFAVITVGETGNSERTWDSAPHDVRSQSKSRVAVSSGVEPSRNMTDSAMPANAPLAKATCSSPLTISKRIR